MKNAKDIICISFEVLRFSRFVLSINYSEFTIFLQNNTYHGSQKKYIIRNLLIKATASFCIKNKLCLKKI